MIKLKFVDIPLEVVKDEAERFYKYEVGCDYCGGNHDHIDVTKQNENNLAETLLFYLTKKGWRSATATFGLVCPECVESLKINNQLKE